MFNIILRLMSASFIAQPIAFASFPIVLYLYKPEFFLIFGVVTSLFSILSSFCHVRFNVAINIAEKDSEATSLYFLAILSSFFINLLIIPIIFLSYSYINSLYEVYIPILALLLVPLSAFFASVYSATNYLWIRNGEYKKLQNLLVRRSFVNISIQIFGGLISMGSFGLIGGHIIQNMPVKLKKELRLISLFRSIFFNPGRFIKKYNLIPIFKKYNRYPKFSTIESFISSISAHFPLLVVATTLDTKTAGLVFLGARLLLLPTNLLGRHVAQVNVSWSRKLLQRSDFVAQCVKVSASLTLISLLIFLFLKVLYFYGLPENLNDWEGLPSMLLTLAPWFLIQLIVSPMTSILHITNELKKSLAINIFGTVLRLSAIYIAIWLGLNYVLNILVYTSAAYYFLFAIIIMHSLFNWKQGESDV